MAATKVGSCRSFAVVALVWLGLISIGTKQVQGSVHEYENAEFTETGNAFLLYGGSEGLFVNAPNNHGGVANGKSFINFDSSLTLTRTAESAGKITTQGSQVPVEAVIFELSDKDNFGYSFDDGMEKSICCTKDLAAIRGCEVGKIIFQREADNSEWPKSITTYFVGSETTARFKADSVPIPRTGMYTLYFVFCEPDLQGTTLSGKTVWKNPGGYLPGRMTPYLSFYGIMSLAYLALGLVWFIQYTRYWKDILQLQNCITAVIALGMSEMALWYFDYSNFNATGKRPIGITIWAVTFGAVKKTVSRLLILVVSMGYGVVLPTLGGLTSKVVLLGVTYFLAAELLDVMENVGTVNDASGSARLFLVLPVAVLDAFFILWIFTSLSRTLEKLQARRRFAKLELYRKFTNTLAIAVIAAVMWIGYELYFKATDKLSERWETAWVIPAFWIVFTYLILVTICFLWAPSQNSTRYAYSEELGDADDEEEAQALTAGGPLVEIEKGLVKPEKNRKPVNTDVFSLDDDGPEEDKRE
ncbi:hypothetical protein MPTK1_7g07760 [Marchantia polymorpha subsp. ruderalis]|uniref:GOST seven transmembrane domain-containing protein n=2 Tax=Marchantia polymorpha TaxID=3197 RepID=A0A176WA64_MARPO|nr:hypothetical protein AXG93_702s1270 [Marchantia polymorpha subsp. ruderalis]PTQ34772.1 hypothetical protein MARPO_0076s0018 [Marchantia polymorpha]BBN16605.1 hypothetical protein Mp_7g07760 [Marchantia polymorpha subsp. ruderalis]|eukprot:PTQ34772.1 hypothetical protein MARPO_0076s0018 [Marchantia polymorpha]